MFKKKRKNKRILIGASTLMPVAGKMFWFAAKSGLSWAGKDNFAARLMPTLSFRFTQHPVVSSSEWLTRSQAALSWLQRSIVATGHRGSSHSFALHRGWAEAYPETTGYLIETLFDYADLLQREDLRKTAFDCADWLLTVQLENGAFPALTAGNTTPSIFNTGQILFGLTRTISELPPQNPQRKTFLKALFRATGWMVEELEPDGAWRRWAYVPGFVPTYYTRAVWGVLKANTILKSESIEFVMRRALYFYATRFLPDHSIRDWGFWPEKPAFTHTIAYTLEGFLECAILLEEADILEKTRAATDRLISVCSEKGRTAGSYDMDGRGDYRFICCTGNGQLSLVCHRFWEITGEEKYRAAAHAFLMEILNYQSKSWLPGMRGAFPGSVPVWGKYLPLRYPNWGVKFFLDAWKHLK